MKLFLGLIYLVLGVSASLYLMGIAEALPVIPFPAFTVGFLGFCLCYFPAGYTFFQYLQGD